MRPKLGGSVYYNNNVGMLKFHLCPSHIVQGLMLPGPVSPDMLLNASLWVMLTVPEVVGTKGQVTSSLPFSLDPSSISKKDAVTVTSY